MVVEGGVAMKDGRPRRGWLAWDPGGPLAWVDVLLQARNERLEAELDDARCKARLAAADARAETRRCEAAEAAAEALRRELERAQQALRDAEVERLVAERRAERAMDDLSSRVAAARADRTWDLVRRLQAEIDACRRNHGAAGGPV
jgi:hypothetical protein